MGYISDSQVVLHYVTGQAFGPAVGTVPLGISPAVKSIVRVSTTAGGSTGANAVTYSGCADPRSSLRLIPQGLLVM